MGRHIRVNLLVTAMLEDMLPIILAQMALDSIHDISLVIVGERFLNFVHLSSILAKAFGIYDHRRLLPRDMRRWGTVSPRRRHLAHKG